MKLILKTTIETETELNISEPLFFKDVAGSITEVVAIIEETTIKAWESKNRDFIENSATEDCKSLIAKAIEKYTKITEEEFFEVFNRVYAKLSLEPKLKVIRAKEGSEVSL
jgi:hypothetical protein